MEVIGHKVARDKDSAFRAFEGERRLGSFGYAPGDFPVAERFYSMEMSLPIYVGLSEQDQDRVISILVGWMKG